MVYVYVLQSTLDKGYYIGISNDLDKRLEKHNNGGVRSTKKRRPFIMIYTERFEDYQQARLREKELKSYKGGVRFKSLIAGHCRVV